MKTIKTVFEQKFNKWFVLGVILVIIVSIIIIFSFSYKHIYDYIFIIGFDILIIKVLYLKFI